MYEIVETVRKIKEEAKKKGIKISDMLISCDLNINTLSSMSNRGSWIQSNSLAKIADYLNCSVDYLLGRTDNPNVNDNNFYNSSNNVVIGNSSLSNSKNIKINAKETKSNDFDITTIQIAKAFQDLDIFEKTEVMNLISKLSKK